MFYRRPSFIGPICPYVLLNIPIIPHSRLTFSCIYKITNTINNKIYIGSAESCYNRYRSHKNIVNSTSENAKTMAIVRAYAKYGFDKFSFEIIEIIEDVKNLIAREQYWMDFYKSYERKIGYNILQKAYSMLGRKQSDKTKEKFRMAASRRPKSHYEVHRRAVVKIDVFTLKVINEFCSLEEAAKSVNAGSDHITVVCKKRKNSCKGFYWSYKEDYELYGFTEPIDKRSKNFKNQFGEVARTK